MSRGTLFLVVGPSGAGKDTLIDGARRALADDPRFVFPRRVITRPGDSGGEAHDTLGIEEFRLAQQRGAFALFWDAHGLCYGIPSTIEEHLVAARHIVVNVSRSVIAAARAVPTARDHRGLGPDIAAGGATCRTRSGECRGYGPPA